MKNTKIEIPEVLKWLLLLLLEIYLLLPYVVYRRNAAAVKTQEAEAEVERQNSSPFGPIAPGGHYSDPSSNITGK